MLKKIIASIVVLYFSLLSSVSIAEKLVLTIASVEGQTKGKVTIDLFADKAPNHVERIKRLATEGKYDGVVFHRVISGFMAQTGDVQYGKNDSLSPNVGTGGSSYDDLHAEFSNHPFTEGVVGMARSRYVHSANSQFFIMTYDQYSLNGKYTIIGAVSEGMDVVHQIKRGSRSQNGAVSEPDFIQSAVIVQ